MTACDIFAFLPCKRRIIYHKVHGNGGLGYLLERDRNRILGGAEGISDVDIRNTGNSHD